MLLALLMFSIARRIVVAMVATSRPRSSFPILRLLVGANSNTKSRDMKLKQHVTLITLTDQQIVDYRCGSLSKSVNTIHVF